MITQQEEGVFAFQTLAFINYFDINRIIMLDMGGGSTQLVWHENNKYQVCGFSVGSANFKASLLNMFPLPTNIETLSSFTQTVIPFKQDEMEQIHHKINAGSVVIAKGGAQKFLYKALAKIGCETQPKDNCYDIQELTCFIGKLSTKTSEEIKTTFKESGDLAVNLYTNAIAIYAGIMAPNHITKVCFPQNNQDFSFVDTLQNWDAIQNAYNNTYPTTSSTQEQSEMNIYVNGVNSIIGGALIIGTLLGIKALMPFFQECYCCGCLLHAKFAEV